MNPYQHALRLARLGFHVFPLVAWAGDGRSQDGKIPAIEDFPNRATCDEVTLRRWFMDEVMDLPHHYNLGISTTRYGENEALVVIDVDDKNGKNGSAELLKLELQGFELPDTFTQRTPSGGRHLVFRAPEPVKQGVDVLGRGLDIRSKGGFIVASGSRIGEKAYTDNAGAIELAPQWLIDRCGKPIERKHDGSTEAPENVDQARARERVIRYLRNDAPESIKGSGGDHTAYKVACRVKDLGVSEDDALDLMMEHWFEGSGWSRDRLGEKIAHAYRYGKHGVGTAAAEMQFKAVASDATETATVDLGAGSPINAYNREYAFALIGGSHSILWETEDAEGKRELRFLSEDTFQRYHSGEIIFEQREKKNAKTGQIEVVTEVVDLPKRWLTAPARYEPPGPNADGVIPPWRRTYKGVWFAPGVPCPPGYYNIWRGFLWEPLPPDEKPDPDHKWAVDAWFEHLHDNVCGGNVIHTEWLIAWVAHLIQRPWEKPLVALVLKGPKGTGKNSFIERVRDLIGAPHAITAIHRRYLTGQFNGHLDSMLLLIVDEAIWAGDKEGEGVLKGLVTGDKHMIERKGKEMYPVPNLTRLAILGNEDWIVPATHDERRYAVLQMGVKRQKDQTFFKRMRELLNAGGARYLMRRLLDVDLSKVNINEAPNTDALLDQKTESLSPVHAWWLTCLRQGSIVNADFVTGWPETIEPQQLYNAIHRFYKAHNARARVPINQHLGRHLKLACPPLKHDRLGKNADGIQPYVYRLPPLREAREAWEQHINHKVQWDEV
jgi:hypothetical protein